MRLYPKSLPPFRNVAKGWATRPTMKANSNASPASNSGIGPAVPSTNVPTVGTTTPTLRPCEKPPRSGHPKIQSQRLRHPPGHAQPPYRNSELTYLSDIILWHTLVPKEELKGRANRPTAGSDVPIGSRSSQRRGPVAQRMRSDQDRHRARLIGPSCQLRMDPRRPERRPPAAVHRVCS
jgi:hypothetical protein